MRALRARRFKAIYLLHHSTTIAIQAMLARIPQRFGYGIGMQRWFLNQPPVLPVSAKQLHPFERASMWLQAAGIPVEEAEPVLSVDASIVAAVRVRIRGTPVAIGIGSSDPARQWGSERFATLVRALSQRGVTDMALVGGPGEASMAREIAVVAAHASIIDTTTWSVPEVAALLSLSAFYVGNDSGFMNVAAAVGIRAYSLSGALLSFRHSDRVVPIVPPGGPSRADGMTRISLEQVLAALDADQALRRFGKVAGLTT
jgi:heptosyltransferase-2